ncbi:hypothetical protein KDL44_04245 [bacterium]|nr:hypothetical protein [bacterium]
MLGRIADEIWQRNNQVYSNVSNDLYRIMPNHLHALLLLEHHGADAERPPKLGTVINSFKGAVTKEARLTTGIPGLAIWQNGFHEKIVNSEASLNRIRQYILYNPHLDELRRTGGA